MGKCKPHELFKGASFVVTGLQRADPHLPESRCVNDLVRELEQSIVDSGGTLLASFEDPPRPVTLTPTRWAALPSHVLVSEKEHRTLKYLVAVAAGIPCVHYRWVRHCVKQCVLLPYQPYLLPAGLALHPAELVYHVEGRLALAGASVTAVGSPAFEQQWGAIMRAAGAKFISGDLKAVEYAVVEPGVPASRLCTLPESVQRVSAEW
eukprot:m51a1_g9087 hypothetical protein (207) ;mRNA; r:42051-42878